MGGGWLGRGSIDTRMGMTKNSKESSLRRVRVSIWSLGGMTFQMWWCALDREGLKLNRAFRNRDLCIIWLLLIVLL